MLLTIIVLHKYNNVNLFTRLFYKSTLKLDLYLQTGGNIVQKHYLYWPRRAFRKSSTHWKFRQLPCNIVLVTAEEHREIHAQRRASEMPTGEQMLQKLDLCKDCKGNCILHTHLVEQALES